MSKTILVTGGAGFIGYHLCKKLLDEGNTVICVDNLTSGSIENTKRLTNNKKYSFYKHDVENIFMIDSDIDEIYHLACPASPPFYQSNPIKTLDTNYIGTKNILELAVKKKSKVLLTSTSEVYGDPIISPQHEEYRGNVNTIGIRSCYDEGKRIAETLMIEYERCYKLTVKIARIFNTYGPYMNKNDGRVVSNFINQMIDDKDITVYGDGKQTRSFCYVDDTVEGLIKLMNTDGFRGPVNIGNNAEMTINELLVTIQLLMPDTKTSIVYKDLPEDDPKQRRPNINLAREKLNWEPKIFLYEGLKHTINYFNSLRTDDMLEILNVTY
uniref:NAD-dependent epimerase/dehydratase domain-containing protein n=1 Tax=viral metagenome TaxID=1070528 RepID=A0A6C0BUI1_9ZZZZ